MALADKLQRLDDRTFDDLTREARQRIVRYTPELTDFNDGDAAMALVDVLAYMTDLLLFRLNQVPAHARLKFLELVGVRLEPARPAEAYVTFAVESDYPSGTVEVPRRTQIAAPPDADGPVVFETTRRLIAFAPTLDAVLTFVGGITIDRSAINGEAAEAWPSFTESPDPGNALLLGFSYDGEFPAGIELCLTFWMAQGQGLDPVTCGSAPVTAGTRLAWEAFDGRDWRAMTVLRDETSAFFRTGQIFLKTPARGVMRRAAIGGTAIPRYWIRARVERSGWNRPPRLLTVRTNTAHATQGETVEGEILGGSDGTAEQTFRLANRPVIAGSLTLEIDEGEGFRLWQEVDDFVDPALTTGLVKEVRDQQRFYVLDQSAAIVLVNGSHAHAPIANPDRPTSNVRATSYRFGGGLRGNVPGRAIATLLSPVEGLDASRTTNLFPAAGGTDEETLEGAEMRGARTLKSRGRAVTAEDFETIALAAGPVGRAKALPLHHPDFPDHEVPGTVTVVIVPAEEGVSPRPSDALLRCVCGALDRARLLTTEVFVVAPRYLDIAVHAELFPDPDADESEVREAALEALQTHFHPLTGGPDRTGWPFGGAIYFSRVHQVLLFPGVARIGRVEVEVDGVRYPPCTDIPIPPGALLASANHEVSVLLDSGEDVP